MTETQRKTCRYCPRSLKGRRSNARFCTDAHRIQWHLEKKRREEQAEIKALRARVKELEAQLKEV